LLSRQKPKTCAVDEHASSSASLQYSITEWTICWSASSVKYDFIGLRQQRSSSRQTRRLRRHAAGYTNYCNVDTRTRRDRVKTCSSCDNSMSLSSTRCHYLATSLVVVLEATQLEHTRSQQRVFAVVCCHGCM